MHKVCRVSGVSGASHARISLRLLYFISFYASLSTYLASYASLGSSTVAYMYYGN